MKKTSSLMTMMFLTAMIPLAAVLITLPLLPDKVPVHYDINMNVDRFGSKYENFLFPAAVIIITTFMYGMARFSAKQENGESNQRVLFITGTILNLFFSGMTVSALVRCFRSAGNQTDSPENFIKFIFIGTGIVLSVVGNFTPKCKLNSVVGIRTKWSMANEDVWFKCQRFGGALMVVCGIIIAVFSALLDNVIAVLIMSSCVFALMLTALIAESKRIYDKCEKPKE